MLIPTDIFTAMLIETSGEEEEQEEEQEEQQEEEEQEEEQEEERVPISELRKIRTEAAKYRKQLRALEAKVGESANAKEKADAQAAIDKLEGLEKEQALTAEANKQLAEAIATIAQRDGRIKAQAIGAAVYSAANAAGFESPEDAAALLDLSGIEVTDGEVDPEEINELVNTLAESKSYLLKGDADTENGNVGPTNPGNKGGGPKPKFTGKGDIARLKQQANEGMAKGDMSSAISLYNKAWEKERGERP